MHTDSRNSFKSWLINRTLLVLLGPLLVNLSAAEQNNLITTISASDMTGIHESRLAPDAFDVSANGGEIAVEFRALHDDKSVTVWIGIWQLPAKQLLQSCQVDELSPSESQNLELVSEVRFSPDGERIVVLTGPRIRIVSAVDCKKIALLHPAALKTKPPNKPTFRVFDVSPDADLVVVLSDDASYGLPGIRALSEAESSIQVFSLKDGSLLSEFVVNGAFRDMAVAPDGSRVLLSGDFGAPPLSDDADVLLFDAKNGAVIEKIHTGFNWLKIPGNGLPVSFLSPTQIMVAPSADSNSSGKYGGKALKVFDLNTGKVSREITTRHFGPLGTLSVAPHAPIAAMVNFWQSRTEILSDWQIHHAKAELLAFRLTDGSSFRIAAPIQRGRFAFTLDQYCLRLSGNGSVVALFEDGTVNVYRVPPRGF